MELWKVLVLAVVQGIGEFLPISSSGHVVVTAALLNQSSTPGGVDFEVAEINIVLHLGTLLSILIFYWSRVWRLLREDQRLIPLLIVGTLPAAVVGLSIKQYVPHLLDSPLLAGLMFPITGLTLLLSQRIGQGNVDYQRLTWRQAMAIGVAQAVAILPGISRSGSTISAGLLVGLRRESAATFSFLLAIPAIFGAGVLEARHLLKDLHAHTYVPSTTPLNLLIGAAVSFIVGLLALWLLVRLLERGRMELFGWYTIGLGIVVTTWQLWSRFGS